LLTASQLHDLLSGRRHGPAAGLLRCALRLAEVPYTWAVRWRNWRYDRGAAEVHRAGVPVVSVGNLTLGGTGKTPTVEWLAGWFRGRGIRVTVISRGYGSESGAKNDEALELAQKLPDVPHLQDPDRVAAARAAVEQSHCDLILLDDGFQHRRLGRDLDIVMLDALEPFGFGHVFPRGTLREPLSGLRRADIVVLSRADVLIPEERENVWETVRRFAPKACCAETVQVPRSLLDYHGREEPLESLRGRPVAAFCGIGNPAGFRHTLGQERARDEGRGAGDEGSGVRGQGSGFGVGSSRTALQCGYKVVGFREFPDHHRYGPADVESLGEWAGRLAVDAVLCTHKDLVKLRLDRLGGRPLWAVRIGLEFLAGQTAFESRLIALLAK
jgi:tetraacyldisaccharide 4'-kinase